ncbi:hypothetical protein GcM1_175025 [Golovinomyces cichoracearum]|uniref:Secreted effector protein n=1 Tax=Golovinomyces cichoracearum TaxID=62708 RepID=A0A420J5R3_9PEZI|nr:hypothetical protein GcM1_175025 [Golovinomyces cichoracearum]
MHSLYFHIIVTVIILPMVVAYPDSKQESDLSSTTDSKGLLLRDLETPVSTTKTRPDSIRKRGLRRKPKIGKYCDARFYSQKDIDVARRKYCQKNAARLIDNKMVNTMSKPVIPSHLFFELKGNYVKILISDYIITYRVKSFLINFLDLGIRIILL